MAEILDSGNRTEFESGAVRDIQEGKGRCDLLPLDVVAYVYKHTDWTNGRNKHDIAAMFANIDNFIKTGHEYYLLEAWLYFLDFSDYAAFSESLLEVAKHFEDGAKKYGERNWEKGIPVSRYIDSGVRHVLKFIRGDTDERHDRAFCWNMMCAIWTCKHKPELNDYAKNE